MAKEREGISAMLCVYSLCDLRGYAFLSARYTTTDTDGISTHPPPLTSSGERDLDRSDENFESFESRIFFHEFRIAGTTARNGRSEKFMIINTFSVSFGSFRRINNPASDSMLTLMSFFLEL
jgi:hypothetical protein